MECCFPGQMCTTEGLYLLFAGGCTRMQRKGNNVVTRCIRPFTSSYHALITGRYINVIANLFSIRKVQHVEEDKEIQHTKTVAGVFVEPS